MGLKAPPARSTLSDALNQRDWRIYHALAQRLIVRARALYAQDSVLELDASVYALDATTIDLCLSLFEWAPFRSTKAAIKLHTLLDLRGAIPAFIHISNGKLHDVNVLDILPVEAGAFYVMDRGYVDFERLYAMHQAGAFFVTRAKSGMDARRVYSTRTDRASGVICDQRIKLNGFYSAKNYPEHLRRVRFKRPRVGQDAGVPDQQHDAADRRDSTSSAKKSNSRSRASGAGRSGRSDGVISIKVSPAAQPSAKASDAALVAGRSCRRISASVSAASKRIGSAPTIASWRVAIARA